MKEIIDKLDRILTLTSGHGIYVSRENRLAESEEELEYIQSKIKFNAIKALELIHSSDKEISAMEKQPEYEYTKVTESIFDLKDDFESLSLYWVNDCGSAMEYIKVYKNDFSMLAKQYESKNLYRRVEITPEQKREREVGELAEVIMSTDGINMFKAQAKDIAANLIEWMESKK